MFKNICYCKICSFPAIYFSKKKYTEVEAKKELSFTCNDCMWKILQERWSKSKIEQLTIF